jgi:hypothetical protein
MDKRDKMIRGFVSKYKLRPYSRTPDQHDRMREREEGRGSYRGYQSGTQQRAAQGLTERRQMRNAQGMTNYPVEKPAKYRA